MIDDIKTNASTNQNIWKDTPDQPKGWSYEELMQFIEEDVMLRIKCESCSYEEDVLEWIFEEFLEIELCKGSKERQYSYQCPECNKTMLRK